MSQTAAAAAVNASAAPGIAEDKPPGAAETRTSSSPDRLEVEVWAQPLAISTAWWLLIAVAVVQELAR